GPAATSTLAIRFRAEIVPIPGTDCRTTIKMDSNPSVSMIRKLALGVALPLALIPTAPRPVQGPGPPRFGARVEVVRLSVLVRGGDRPAGELTAASFQVEDNGVPQRVDQVSVEDRPVTLILALDVSGSVRGDVLAQLKRACVAAIEQLRPGESGQLLTFSGDLRRFDVP